MMQALQAFFGIHIGIDNLNLKLGALLSSLTEEMRVLPSLLSKMVISHLPSTPCSVCEEGLFNVSKVKGHADQAMINVGDVRNEDRIGNDGADTAADLGRLRQKDEAITATRALIRVGSNWYPIMLYVCNFMVAIARIEVNDDGHGGTAPNAMTWDQGRSIKPRASSFWVTIDHVSLPGPPGFLDSSWRSLFHSSITQEDVAVWPHSVSIPQLQFTDKVFASPGGTETLRFRSCCSSTSSSWRRGRSPGFCFSEDQRESAVAVRRQGRGGAEADPKVLLVVEVPHLQLIHKAPSPIVAQKQISTGFV